MELNDAQIVDVFTELNRHGFWRSAPAITQLEAAYLLWPGSA